MLKVLASYYQEKARISTLTIPLEVFNIVLCILAISIRKKKKRTLISTSHIIRKVTQSALKYKMPNYVCNKNTHFTKIPFRGRIKETSV